jgi:deazaflavin-dependent oxidoreductase (nitroreductase family)
MESRPTGKKSKSPRRGGVVDRVFRPIAIRVGLAWYLEVPGRRSGSVHRIALIPQSVDDRWYLLSTYGCSQWVQNLRSAGGGTLIRRTGTEPFTAVEVDPDERDRVIARFRERAPIVVRREFDRLPDPRDHPAFRIVPADPDVSSRGEIARDGA